MSVYLIDRTGTIRYVRSTWKESVPTDDPRLDEVIAVVLAQ